MDFEPELAADQEWADSFFDGAFDAVDGPNGEIWGVPQTRDAIGIYYNKSIFAEAGVTEFPQTWDDLDAACEQVKSAGQTCLAMDGNWVTLLMWANLIGTQDGGADFLSSGIADGDYEASAPVVQATETLRDWHEQDYVNSDSFTGDYQNAATPFVQGEAAMIANGPWMVSADIEAETAKSGLYDEIGYEVSPGWTADGRGSIVVSGQGSLISGATSPEAQEAVTAFMKFYTSPDIMFGQTIATGSYFPVDASLSKDQQEQLEPLALHVVEESTNTAYAYPHAFFASPAGFSDAWNNLWPAYAKGDLDTTEFLTRLGTDATAGAAG
jgi:raffinose/stachyose/melibiose transport system substrate-binding protein